MLNAHLLNVMSLIIVLNLRLLSSFISCCTHVIRWKIENTHVRNLSFTLSLYSGRHFAVDGDLVYFFVA